MEGAVDGCNDFAIVHRFIRPNWNALLSICILRVPYCLVLSFYTLLLSMLCSFPFIQAIFLPKEANTIKSMISVQHYSYQVSL